MADLDDDAIARFKEIFGPAGLAHNMRVFGQEIPTAEQLQRKIDEMKANPRPVTMTKEYYLEWIEEELLRAFKLVRNVSEDKLSDIVKSEAKNLAEISGWGGCQN